MLIVLDYVALNVLAVYVAFVVAGLLSSLCLLRHYIFYVFLLCALPCGVC